MLMENSKTLKFLNIILWFGNSRIRKLFNVKIVIKNSANNSKKIYRHNIKKLKIIRIRTLRIKNYSNNTSLKNSKAPKF